MFKVDCPGCKASYNVDERRVPDAGLKMRCPKCSTTFTVHRPGNDDTADLPLVAGPSRGGLDSGPDLPAVRQKADLPAVAPKAAPKPPAAPAPRPAPPKPAPRQTVQGIGIELDLPDTRAAKPAAPTPDEEADLPLAANRAPALPATKQPPKAPPPRKPSAPVAPAPAAFDDDGEFGLPSPVAKKPPPATDPRRVTGGSLFGDVDLPAPVGAGLPVTAGVGGGGSMADFELDLPAPGGGGVGLPALGGGVDLPALGGGVDLPALGGGVDLPALGGGVDLPALGGVDLPAVGSVGLPAVGGVGLPAVGGLGLPATRAPMASSGGFGELDLPTVGPAAGGGAFGGGAPEFPTFGEAPSFSADPFSGSAGPPSLGDADGFGKPAPFSVPPGPEEADPFGAKPDPFGRPPSSPAAPAPLQRQAGGGVSFGEVDLGDGGDALPNDPPPASGGGAGWGERDLGGGGDDDMEFGAIPQEGVARAPAGGGSVAPPPAGARVVAAPTVRRTETEPAPPPKRGRGLKIAAGLMAVVIAAGVGTSFTEHGPFGWHLAYDAMKAKDWEQALQATAKRARGSMAQDTSASGADAGRVADAAAVANERATAITAYAAYVAFARELRFGRDPALHARGKTLFATMPTEATGFGYDHARAAQLAANDQVPRGLAAAEGLARRSPTDPDAVSLAAEIAIISRDADKAMAHFTRLATIETGPRAQFGIARAHMLKGERDKAEAAAKKVVDTAPAHAGARLLLGRLIWDGTKDDVATAGYVDKVLKDPAVRAGASSADVVMAFTLTGEMALRKSRVTAAEAAFNEALKLDSRAPGALSGVGEALYRGARYAEALARFNSAMEADPEAIVPKIGVAKTKIALERLQEAKDLLKNLAKKLRDDNKPSFQVLAWLGRTEESLGDKPAAESNYLEAIKLAGVDSEIVETYVSLAQLLLGLGRPAEAVAKLEEAKGKLPKSVGLHKALGDIAFQAGRYEEAEREFDAALALDESELATRFRLGVTQRRMGKFEAAAVALDKVAASDKEYPGLSLERAVLFEASGQSGKALEMYEAALAKAPNDPDLMLRVAAAQLATPSAPIAKAEELLRKVLQVRQNSAEVNHYMGRALLMRGTNLAEALKYLRRAVEIDPNRAEYWLYVGWAANEADQQSVAADALDKALDRDKSLADAYWQRGVLRRRQRQVIDAETDLKKALELRPSRYEAYATLAEVYEDQQRWPAAQDAWSKALKQNGDRADWQFRMGKLVKDHGNRAGALEYLSKAHEIVMRAQTKPDWLAECSHLLGEAELAAGKKELTIQHFQQYLSLAPPESPYRADVCRKLKQLGDEARGCR